MVPAQLTSEKRKNRITVAAGIVFFIFKSFKIFTLVNAMLLGAWADQVGLWSYALEHFPLLKRMKIDVPPDRRFPMTVNTGGFIARCPQETGIGIPLDLPAGARFPVAVIPSVEGMTGRARQVADIDFLKIVVKQLDIACGLLIEREDIVNQFAFWMAGHGRYFVFRHVAF